MWSIKPRSAIRMGLVVQIFCDGGGELPEFVGHLDGLLKNGRDESAWRVYSCPIAGEDFTVRIYRKRLIICRDTTMEKLGAATIDGAIRYVVDRAGGWLSAAAALLPEGVRLKSLPFFFSDDIKISRNDIFDEGITSFNYRIHNARTGRVGIIRISRHLLMCCGLNDAMKQEVINSCYEKLLICEEPIVADDIFSFMESLNRFAVSGEENGFLQMLAIKITVLFSVITILGQLVDYFNLPPVWKAASYAALCLLIYPAYKLLGKLMERFGRR